MVYEREDEWLAEKIYRRLPLMFFHWTDHKRNSGWEFFKPFTSPRYENTPNKPVSDCAKPTSWIDENDQRRRMAASQWSFYFQSHAHFQGVGPWEPVEGTSTYTNYDLFKMGFVLYNYFAWQLYINANVAAQTNVLNPRTRWAHNIALASRLFRSNLAFFFGFMGYIWVYEGLYTYGPVPEHFANIGINDPSIKGWYACWREGQFSGYARAIAAGICFPLGYVLYRGGLKKSGAWSFNFGLAAWYYEWCRATSFDANRAMCSVIASEWNMREAKYGSLKPDLRRHLDPVTNKPLHQTQSEYISSSHGKWHKMAIDNLTPDDFPMNPGGTHIPNPYYNPLKRPQYYDKSPKFFKNQYFKLPHPIGARMLSTAADEPVVARM